MLFLTEADVRRLLPMSEAIRLVREGFRRLAAGEALNQPRHRLILPTRSVLHYMAASDGRYFGAKVYATNPGHGAHFQFLLYRAEDAQPLATIQANYLGQIRTGAASGLATQLMARPDCDRVAIIGTGFQAASQLEAMRTVLPQARIRVWSRSPEKRAAFAAEYGVEAAATAEEAVRGAAVVVTATNAKDPVLEDSWIAPGTHVNAMGSNQARRREIPAELLCRADRIVADSISQSQIEAGDLLLGLPQDQWTRIVELKDVVAGSAAGRTGPQEITLFKSIGLALEDVICAGWVYERAVESGAAHS